ncbi:MAG TPA: 3-oxoacyl-[acyl-carrier-protein] synthase III C-terminal domain-containing protein [Acidimicrobiales bacterium]|nr:3-oxoacyl-[acyl-carrier-protein] synthase III C-terminal domain-containing protein [Acidimicrobiales bacterium]
MATTLDRPAVVTGRRTVHRSARKMADRASRAAIEQAGLKSGDIDLLVNVGLYHERNLGEPALAALIQEDVGINPEDPHAGGHGSFSFDIANGGCGVLTALQVADGFLQSGVIEHALVVASDADPRHGLATGFPFSPTGAAVVCSWQEGAIGLAGFRWETAPEEGYPFRSRVSFEHGRNVLRIEKDADFDSRAAAWAAKTATSLLADRDMRPADVDLVIASPLTPAFLEGLSAHVGIGLERVLVVEGAEHVHTAALLVALASAAEQGRLRDARRALLVSAGAGMVVGAAVLVHGREVET